MIETCFLIRHEDKKIKGSKSILEHIMDNIPRCKPCICQVLMFKESRKIQTKRITCIVCRSGRHDEAGYSNDSGIAPLHLDSDSGGEQEDEDTEYSNWADGAGGSPEKAESSSSSSHAVTVQRDQSQATLACLDIIRKMVQHVVMIKASEGLAISYRRAYHAGHSLRLVINQLSSEFLGGMNDYERFLCCSLLQAAKLAAEHTPFGLKTSETIKRKVHGLTLMLYILKKSGAFFRTSEQAVLILRRFLCPILLECFLTDDQAVFSLVLQTFIVLWHNFKGVLLMELGVLVDDIFITLLNSRFCRHARKKDIIEVFAHIFHAPEAVVNLFSNFDNAVPSWGLYERLVEVLCKITQGLVSDGKLASTTLPSGPPSGQAAGHNVPSATSEAPAEAEDPNIQKERHLRKRALKLMVQILHMLAQWSGVPGLRNNGKSPKTKRKKAVDDSTDSATSKKGADSESPARSRLASPGSGGASSDGWSLRFAERKAEQKVIEDTLHLAKVKDLKTALTHLRSANPAWDKPREIARFFFQHESLNKSDIGDILGTEADKFLSKEGYETLRREYLNFFDFTNMSFDRAFRYYLTECGFRLPGEAQKIDRLIQAFCESYHRDNPRIFKSGDAAFVLAFALVMLNTDLHDPRLGRKKEGPSRKPMTQEEFIKQLRGVNDGTDFDRAWLAELYQSIKNNAVEWKESKEDKVENKGDKVTEEEEERQRSLALRKLLELSVRRAQGKVRSSRTVLRGFHGAVSPTIVQGMFEISWLRFITAITTLLETSRDVDALHLCLDGLAYGSTISIVLGLSTERLAFTRLLAKITYLENNRGAAEGVKNEKMGRDLHERIINGDHLKQDWYKPLNLQSEKSPAKACAVVLKVQNDMKQKISYEHRQAVLRRLQADFGNDINLVDSVREFVKDGRLLKMSESTKREASYHFFLFSHLLCYAADAMQAKFKLRRAIHLSLAKVIDLKNYSVNHAFKIISPQKSFVVAATSAQEKRDWLDAIAKQAKIIIEERKTYLEAGPSEKEKEKLQSEGENNEEDEQLRRYSTFLGHTNSSENFFPDQKNQERKGAATYCKLCIKVFGFFRKGSECRWCRDPVCSDCHKQRAKLPGPGRSKKRVCDACFGVLTGMVSQDSEFLTEIDCKRHPDLSIIGTTASSTSTPPSVSSPTPPLTSTGSTSSVGTSSPGGALGSTSAPKKA